MGRYLIAASPIPGHAAPMIGIAADLVARGHQVSLLTGPEYAATAARHGLRFHELPDEARPARPQPATRSSGLLPRWQRGRQDMHDVFIAPLPAQHRALAEALAAQPVDAVFCDLAFTGALPLLLDDAPRPKLLVCGVGPLTLSSADTPPFGMGWQPRPGTDYRPMTTVVHRLFFRAIGRRFDAALGAHSPVFVTDWPLLADRILQLTVPGTEYPRRDLPPHLVFTGPVLGPSAGRSGRDWNHLRGTVVHVTQGTWDNADLGELLRPTLDALADRDDVTVVATTGRNGELHGPIPRNAVVTDFADYAALLPRVDVMITNGGYGGVHQALSHGIPLIVAGQAADKHEVAARIDYTGAGVNLDTARPTATAIADAVTRITTVPSYRANAQRLQREILSYNAFDVISGELDGLLDASPAR